MASPRARQAAAARARMDAECAARPPAFKATCPCGQAFMVQEGAGKVHEHACKCGRKFKLEQAG